MPTLALAMVSASSLLLTSGLRFSNDEGMPVDKFSLKDISFKVALRFIFSGNSPVKICKAFYLPHQHRRRLRAG